MSGADWTVVERRLAAICGADFSRPGGAADSVGGVPSRFVAMPGRAEAAAEVLRLATQRDLGVVPRGAGTKVDWGWPPSRLDITLDVGRLAGPDGSLEGDVVEVGAGTPLQALQAMLKPTGRRLPIDVRTADATIGGVVANDEVGPLRLRHGTIRDHLVGISYLDALGNLVRVDSKVPGAASGTDAIRLFCGSQGELGVLVSATLRPQPAPATRVWTSYPVQNLTELAELVPVISRLTAVVAIEVDLPPGGAMHAGRPGIGTFAVLFEGERSAVADGVATLAALAEGSGHATTRPPGWWPQYPFLPGDIALRIEVPIGKLPHAIPVLGDTLFPRPPLRGSVGNGALYAALPGDLPPEKAAGIIDLMRGVTHRLEGQCRVIAAPPPLRELVDPGANPSDLESLQEFKERVDPDRRLAPGRLLSGTWV